MSLSMQSRPNYTWFISEWDYLSAVLVRGKQTCFLLTSQWSCPQSRCWNQSWQWAGWAAPSGHVCVAAQWQHSQMLCSATIHDLLRLTAWNRPAVKHRSPATFLDNSSLYPTSSFKMSSAYSYFCCSYCSGLFRITHTFFFFTSGADSDTSALVFVF